MGDPNGWMRHVGRAFLARRGLRMDAATALYEFPSVKLIRPAGRFRLVATSALSLMTSKMTYLVPS